MYIPFNSTLIVHIMNNDCDFQIPMMVHRMLYHCNISPLTNTAPLAAGAEGDCVHAVFAIGIGGKGSYPSPAAKKMHSKMSAEVVCCM